MVFHNKGVVVPLGGAGEADDAHTYTPSPIKFNDKTYLYYGGYDGTASARTFLGISKNGVNFVKKGVVIPVGGSGQIDDTHAFNPRFLKYNNKIYAYYSAVKAGTYRGALAISEDGVNFVKKGVVISLGGFGDFDDSHVYPVGAIEHNGKVYCYYAGHDGIYIRIGLAISKDGVNFVKKGVVNLLGGAGQIDDKEVYIPNVIKLNDKFYCFYTAFDTATTDYRIALAISEDGFNFVKKGVVVPLGGSGESNDNHQEGTGIIKVNDKIYAYGAGHDGSAWRVTLAISAGCI